MFKEIFLLFMLAFTSVLTAGELNAPPQTDNKSGFNFDSKVSDADIKVFFDFSVQEMQNLNFGTSRDLFETITKKTDKFPMAHYFLATLYTDTRGMQDIALAKKHLEKFVESKKAEKSFVQDAYSRLIDLETDEKKAMRYAKKSLKIGRNTISLNCMIKANQKLYLKTSEDKYSSMIDICSKEIQELYSGRNKTTIYSRTMLGPDEKIIFTSTTR